MKPQTRAEFQTNPDEKWMLRVGGLAAIVLGIAYIVIIGLYVPMGASPLGVEARLKYIAGNIPAWWAILILSVLTDFLFIPLHSPFTRP